VKKQVLFVQGAGQGAHEEDARLVASLGDLLGAGYEIRFPTMPNEDSPDDDVWSARLAEELATMGKGVAVVGHSPGAATLLMFLADKKPKQTLTGIFLIGAPFLGEGGWDNKGAAELPMLLRPSCHFCSRLRRFRASQKSQRQAA
jgi:predicted alpha/beta hydrolase family esterase